MTEAGERGSERRKGGQRAEAKEGRESGREIRREKEGDDVVFYLFFLRFFFLSPALFFLSVFICLREGNEQSKKVDYEKKKKASANVTQLCPRYYPPGSRKSQRFIH